MHAAKALARVKHITDYILCNRRGTYHFCNDTKRIFPEEK